MSGDQNRRDEAHMRAALALARRGLGRVAPNPAVGCVLVRPGPDGADQVVGRGWTQPGGRPHAEPVALAQAGALARGATAYVTLEPCAHHGQTPPCADALIAAGVARVVVALRDSDARVDGRGLDRLRTAGIAVSLGVLSAEARALNAGFFSRVERGRPLVTLKLATSLDGRIATHGGESQWITGEVARAFGHRLRASHDAIMIGSTTARVDNPSLTCRLPGLGDRSPVRIVVDSRLSLSLTAKLVATASQTPTWLVTVPASRGPRREALQGAGVEILEVAPTADDGLPDLPAVLAALGGRGLTRLLVEGGARLAAALVRADLIDRLCWFRAPCLIGGDGLAALEAFGLDRLADSPRFRRTQVLSLGDDLLEEYERGGRPETAQRP